jgi:hypothetical protein
MSFVDNGISPLSKDLAIIRSRSRLKRENISYLGGAAMMLHSALLVRVFEVADVLSLGHRNFESK